MRKRVFIAIRLPDDVLEKLIEVVKKWQWLPIRWINPENWHVTLVPPLYVTYRELASLREVLYDRLRNIKPFELSMGVILFAPPERRARMIWYGGKRSRKLQALKESIAQALHNAGFSGKFITEKRPVSPHVTLARFREGDLRELEQKTKTLEELPLSFLVNAIDIMESQLKPTGAEYKVIESLSLSKDHAKTSV